MTKCTADVLYSRPLATDGNHNVGDFGSRNAALGEMIRLMDVAGLWVPKGFAVSASGHRRFMRTNGVNAWANELVSAINENGSNIAEIGAAIRSSILSLNRKMSTRPKFVSHARMRPSFPSLMRCTELQNKRTPI